MELGKKMILIHARSVVSYLSISARGVFSYHDDKEGLEIFSRKLSDILRSCRFITPTFHPVLESVGIYS